MRDVAWRCRVSVPRLAAAERALVSMNVSIGHDWQWTHTAACPIDSTATPRHPLMPCPCTRRRKFKDMKSGHLGILPFLVKTSQTYSSPGGEIVLQEIVA